MFVAIMAITESAATPMAQRCRQYERNGISRETLFGNHDPYERVDLQKWSKKQGEHWTWTTRNMRKIFSEAVANSSAHIRRPAIVIEVGVWKGGSSIEMAHAVQDLPHGGNVWSVDTFQGAVEMWLKPYKNDSSRDMYLVNGHPMIYWKFLANVIQAGLSKTIVPFPVNSNTAALWFKAKCTQADLIHIDAGHELESVSLDIATWWPVLRRGGTFLGDDYSVNWPGVIQAANDLAAREGVQLMTDNPGGVHIGYFKWWLRKP